MGGLARGGAGQQMQDLSVVHSRTMPWACSLCKSTHSFCLGLDQSTAHFLRGPGHEEKPF